MSELDDRVARRRKRLRLANYDYRAGWFFVTVCTSAKRSVLGTVRGQGVALTALGRLVATCWDELPGFFETCRVQALTVMPDHLHGILALDGQRSTTKRSLGSVVGAFKSRSSRMARESGLMDDSILWQRGFHDRVIRNDRELTTVLRYIDENPMALNLPPRIFDR